MQSIQPCLWFDTQAGGAAAFCVSTFKDSRIVDVARYPDGSPGTAGAVMAVRFVLDGQEFLALNGGPVFTFSPAISLVANCATLAEVDRLWETLTAGGEEGQCGWLTDKYGVSWQIVPNGSG